VVGAPPLPYLYVCAFIANAASFVLPISNPANLVVFGDRMPALGPWLAHFALPSVLAIGSTYVTLRLVFRDDLRQPLKASPPLPPMTWPLRMAALGVAITAGTLLITSALGHRLGLPTLIAGCVSAALVLAVTRSGPLRLIKGVAWGVLPLVAGLFVLVEGMAASGVLQDLANLMRGLSADAALWAGGVGAALSGNVINNLPAGLMAGTLARMADLSSATTAALLIGIDLGPNLSVSGSLATLLWLLAVRREGMHISALSFLRLGIVVMPPALILALGALHVFS
jgi:arsenical pump membrane protein